MATNSRADLLTECRTITATVLVNAPDLEHAQEDRVQLTSTADLIDLAIIRQKYHKSQFQQASRDLEILMLRARDLLLRLKNAIRAQYGMASEKLAEFGLNPRRSAKKPSGEGPTLPETVASETDGTTQK